MSFDWLRLAVWMFLDCPSMIRGCSLHVREASDLSPPPSTTNAASLRFACSYVLLAVGVGGVLLPRCRSAWRASSELHSALRADASRWRAERISREEAEEAEGFFVTRRGRC